MEDVLAIGEGYMKRLFKEVMGMDITLPLPRLTYTQAMEDYGSDKPDTRFDMKITDLSSIVENCGFGVFADTVKNGGTVRLINAKNAASVYTRKEIDKLTEHAKGIGAKGLAFIRWAEDTPNCSFAKFMSEEEMSALMSAANCEKGDVVILVADRKKTVLSVLGALRLEMAKKLGVKTVINFKEATTIEQRVALVKEACGGNLADFAFQCTGAPVAAADIYSYIRRGGGMCEMGFFVNNGEYQINPHFTMCNKEINLVGSWDYSAEDYPTTVAFLRQAREMNIPIKDLITHTFPLDKMNEAMETNVAQAGIKICYIAE
jgi:hypothetical protein